MGVVFLNVDTLLINLVFWFSVLLAMTKQRHKEVK